MGCCLPRQSFSISNAHAREYTATKTKAQQQTNKEKIIHKQQQKANKKTSLTKKSCCCLPRQSFSNAHAREYTATKTKAQQQTNKEKIIHKQQKKANKKTSLTKK